MEDEQLTKRSRTTICLLEDHVLLADTIAAQLALADDLDLVGTSRTISGGLDLAARLQPEVVVTDVQLVDGDMIERLDELASAAPRAKILVYTGLPTEQRLLAALDAGATGFLDKATPLQDFLHAIRAVAREEIAVSGPLLPILARRASSRARPGELTSRELDVLQLLARGHSTRQVADELILSVHTVRNHTCRLLRKLGVHSRIEAIQEGVRRGLIEFQPQP